MQSLGDPISTLRFDAQPNEIRASRERDRLITYQTVTSSAFRDWPYSQQNEKDTLIDSAIRQTR